MKIFCENSSFFESHSSRRSALSTLCSKTSANLLSGLMQICLER